MVAYRIVMRGLDGVEYPLKGVYLEMVQSEGLVMTDCTEAHPAEWRVRPHRNYAGQ
ncbi:MAG: hypothetical protein ACRERX_16430 [Pseudomonas sp.]